MVDRIGRGQYIAKASALAAVREKQSVAVDEVVESPEILRHERDYYRARCQKLQEIVMRLTME